MIGGVRGAPVATSRPGTAHACFVRDGAGGLIDGSWCSAAFEPLLRGLPGDPGPADVSREELLLYRDRTLSISFTPLDHLNPAARVLFVGLTPGRAQARIALRTTIGRLAAGDGLDEALAVAKREASFAGPMRRNLVRMLDGIGLHGALGLATCADLFAERADLMAATSAVCHPVFLADGANWGGTAPALDRHPVLTAFARQVLAAALAGAPAALVVPMGKAAGLGVRLAGADPARVLDGFPHPSGSNGHRVRQYGRERDRLTTAVRAWAGGQDTATAFDCSTARRSTRSFISSPE